MARWLIAGAALMMISCKGSQGVGVDPPKDCAEAMRHDFQYTGRFRAKDERLMLLSCFPFSEAERINGAWVTGFEANEFYEGEQTAGARTHKGISDTQLVINIPSRPGPFMRVSTAYARMEKRPGVAALIVPAGVLQGSISRQWLIRNTGSSPVGVTSLTQWPALSLRCATYRIRSA